MWPHPLIHPAPSSPEIVRDILGKVLPLSMADDEELLGNVASGKHSHRLAAIVHHRYVPERVLEGAAMENYGRLGSSTVSKTTNRKESKQSKTIKQTA